ncbi:MAG: hypothetical protein ACYSVY_28130, partial [Planctomycetota bacterium]|jgi:hypothetical protein
VTETILLVGLAVLLINLPFGYWRDGLRKFSPLWLVAVHAPIPGVIALRLLTGIGYQLISFPVIIGAYFAGQYFGGLLRRKLRSPD